MKGVLFVWVRRDVPMSRIEEEVVRPHSKLTVSKANNCDRVVACIDREPVAVWRLRAGFRTFFKESDDRLMTALSVGDRLDVDLEPYRKIKAQNFRNGWIIVPLGDLDLEPLPLEAYPAHD